MENILNITIRKATKEDIKAVANIKINSWKSTYRGIIDDKFLDNMNLEVEVEKRKNMQNDDLIVAEVQNEIVGFCIYRDYIKDTKNNINADCELSSIYIKQEFKRNGIGSKLMEYVMTDLKNRGKNNMILGCLRENYPSRKFYDKLGGKVIEYDKIKFGDNEYELALYLFNI